MMGLDSRALSKPPGGYWNFQAVPPDHIGDFCLDTPGESADWTRVQNLAVDDQADQDSGSGP